MSENFLLKKNVDRSLLTQGFAIPVKAQEILSLHLSDGTLRHGEKRPIKILLNGEIFDATLRSVNFNRKKFPEHRDIWQIVYSQNSPTADAVRKIFASSVKNLQKNLPPEEQEYFVLYATDLKDTFCFEPIFNREIILPERNELLVENILELPTLTDADAALIERYRLSKIRKLNRSLGDRLKEIYDFRCQICGQRVGVNCSVNVVECHHIDYFVDSLNNDMSNLLIVCPNHHRIIHAANPTFDRKRKFYRYRNGYEEILRINHHL